MTNGIDWGAPEKAIDLLGKHVAMWRWELSSNRVQWSDHLLELLGIEHSDFVGTFETFANLVHPDDAAETERHVQIHLSGGKHYKFRCRMRHADGHYIPMLSQGTAVQNADGAVVEMIGTVTDLSDEANAYDQLVETQRTFRSLSDNVPGAIFQYLVEPNGIDAIKFMSSGCRDIWELSPEDIEEVPARIWDLVHEDDVVCMQDSVLKSAETMEFWSHRWRIKTPSGKIKHLEGRGMPKHLEDGSIAWDSVIIDVSSEEALRDELLKQQEILGHVQKIDAIGRISGGIAHDFNNLLAVVLGNAELVNDADLPPDDAESIDAIIKACFKGAELTRRLLTYARKARLEPEILDVNEVVAQSSIMMSRILPESISIKTITHPDLWQCIADRNFLENSLLNLCINARDAMANGGALIIETKNAHFKETDAEVTSDYIHAGKYVSISVTDTGTGIPPEHIDKVTEPFFTTKGPDMGTGLGLAMVDGFAKQSSGTILIESGLGKGTTIRLLLPSNGKLAGGGQAAEGSGSDPKMVGAGTILVVEDEPGILSMLKKILTTAGFETFYCTDADSAFEEFGNDADHIDVLLSDMVMPGTLQGRALATLMTERYPRMRVVFMSGYANETNVSFEGPENVDKFLMKPVKRIELVEALNNSVAKALTAKD